MSSRTFRPQRIAGSLFIRLIGQTHKRDALARCEGSVCLHNLKAGTLREPSEAGENGRM